MEEKHKRSKMWQQKRVSLAKYAVVLGLILVLLVILCKWSMVQCATIGAGETMTRFWRKSLQYNVRFQYNYPDECKMPRELSYSEREYMKVWLEIFDKLHKRPAALRLHNWLKRVAMCSNKNEQSFLAKDKITSQWLNYASIAGVTIIPFVLELILF